MQGLRKDDCEHDKIDPHGCEVEQYLSFIQWGERPDFLIAFPERLYLIACPRFIAVQDPRLLLRIMSVSFMPALRTSSRNLCSSQPV